jgi:murein DD-endopeptidase MepM/ murein hydrolase activator NlpD
VEPETTEAFDNSLIGLDTALGRLESVRSQAKKLPFNNPSPASDITSTFGNRLDPFLGRLALHAGIDFRAPTGTRILATAPGTVITAGKNGGYGNMVEIDHGNGITTRYAHLSTILVNAGDKIRTGEPIARSGVPTEDDLVRPVLAREDAVDLDAGRTRCEQNAARLRIERATHHAAWRHK